MTSTPDPSLIEIGRITRAHGVRGELRVVLHWERSDSLAHVDEVTLGRGAVHVGTFKVHAARPADRAVLLSLVGIRDRDAAEKLRGATVSVRRSALPALAEGEYYLCDLVGASVASPEGFVGEVVEVRVHPSVDTLVVLAPDGALYEQPVTEPWIVSVDVEGKRVELASRDGLVLP